MSLTHAMGVGASRLTFPKPPPGQPEAECTNRGPLLPGSALRAGPVSCCMSVTLIRVRSSGSPSPSTRMSVPSTLIAGQPCSGVSVSVHGQRLVNASDIRHRVAADTP